MHLVEWNSDGNFSLTKDLLDDEVPPYAILSHTWGPEEDEVTFQMVRPPQSKSESPEGNAGIVSQPESDRDSYAHELESDRATNTSTYDDPQPNFPSDPAAQRDIGIENQGDQKERDSGVSTAGNSTTCVLRRHRFPIPRRARGDPGDRPL